MNGWAVSLAGCALLFGVLLGTMIDQGDGCQKTAKEYFLSVQISGAEGATQTAGVAFAVECDLPLLPNVGPTVTPTVGP